MLYNEVKEDSKSQYSNGDIMYKFIGLLILALFGAAICAPGQYDREHTWVAGNISEPMPKNALIGGISFDGYYVYVGRALFEGSILPASVDPENGIGRCYINSTTYNAGNYQLLVTQPDLSYEWVRSYDGHLEEYSISVGTTNWNEKVFICRSIFSGQLVVGTLVLKRKVCYVSSWSVEKYEVLIAKPKVNLYYNNSKEVIRNSNS